MKLLLPLLMLAAPALAAPSDPGRYAACMEVAPKDPARALQLAYGWLAEGGGVPARHCLAVSQMRAGHHAAALKSYEAAGIQSEDQRDGQAVALWRQAADAAMIAGRPADAARFLTRALARPGGLELSSRAAADLHIARAEARVDSGDDAGALTDLDAATAAAPGETTAWLLKATLHRRRGELAQAEAALLKAAALAPESADVELEAGNIAAAKGDMALARQAWEAAAADGAETPAGRAASAALGRLGPTLPGDAVAEKPLTPAPPPAIPR